VVAPTGMGKVKLLKGILIWHAQSFWHAESMLPNTRHYRHGRSLSIYKNDYTLKLYFQRGLSVVISPLLGKHLAWLKVMQQMSSISSFNIYSINAESWVWLTLSIKADFTLLPRTRQFTSKKHWSCSFAFTSLLYRARTGVLLSSQSIWYYNIHLWDQTTVTRLWHPNKTSVWWGPVPLLSVKLSITQILHDSYPGKDV
jgi:hypothetical protein